MLAGHIGCACGAKREKLFHKYIIDVMTSGYMTLDMQTTIGVYILF